MTIKISKSSEILFCLGLNFILLYLNYRYCCRGYKWCKETPTFNKLLQANYILSGCGTNPFIRDCPRPLLVAIISGACQKKRKTKEIFFIIFFAKPLGSSETIGSFFLCVYSLSFEINRSVYKWSAWLSALSEKCPLKFIIATVF